MAETLSATQRAINNFESTQTVQEVIETYLFWRGEPSHIKSSTLQFAAAKSFARLKETSRAMQFTMLAEQDEMLERQAEVA